MITVRLNEHECVVAKHFGTFRHKAEKAQGWVSTLAGGGTIVDPLETRKQAMGAELAVAKWLNVYPQLEVDGLPPFDLYHYFWGYIDVKHTKKTDGNLLVECRLFNCEHTYVLVRGAMPCFQLVGYLSGVHFQDSDKRNHNNGYYFIPANRLNPIETLMAREGSRQ